jgi:hypothetical protein
MSWGKNRRKKVKGGVRRGTRKVYENYRGNDKRLRHRFSWHKI